MRATGRKRKEIKNKKISKSIILIYVGIKKIF